MGVAQAFLKYSAHGHNNSRKSMMDLTTPADEFAFNRAENPSEIRLERVRAASSNTHFLAKEASSFTGRVIYTSSGQFFASSTVSCFNSQVLDSSQVSTFGVSEAVPPIVVLESLLRRLIPEVLGLTVAVLFSICLFIYALPRYGSTSLSLGFTIAGNLLALALVLFLGSKKVPNW